MKQATIYVSVGQSLQLQWLKAYAQQHSPLPEELSERLNDILGEELAREFARYEEQGYAISFAIKQHHTDEDLEDLGFEGLLMAGLTRQQARDKLAQKLDDVTLSVIRAVRDENPELFEEMRRTWDIQGVLPPWEGKL